MITCCTARLHVAQHDEDNDREEEGESGCGAHTDNRACERRTERRAGAHQLETDVQPEAGPPVSARVRDRRPGATHLPCAHRRIPRRCRHVIVSLRVEAAPSHVDMRGSHVGARSQA